ncbi:hypothetical protein [Pseudomonas syringae group genomosp. 3]|uniref:hypothetical protein n=1 Tax=Pseudomonas syringae group genomosp. 3 TaxID=251701 RepID=UPI0005CACF86|nr:hypothetical protein [Pseudomonas syringae group genomosp. 3]
MKAEHNLNSLNELEIQIGRRIVEFNGKRTENQRKSQLYSLGQLLFGALTTLLIAINTKTSFFSITVATLITSSLASLAGQLLSKYMYAERMASNIATTCALYELSHTITMDRNKEKDDEKNHKITLEKVDVYQDRYQQILTSANGQWQKHIQNKVKEK